MLTSHRPCVCTFGARWRSLSRSDRGSFTDQWLAGEAWSLLPSAHYPIPTYNPRWVAHSGSPNTITTLRELRRARTALWVPRRVPGTSAIARELRGWGCHLGSWSLPAALNGGAGVVNRWPGAWGRGRSRAPGDRSGGRLPPPDYCYSLSSTRSASPWSTRRRPLASMRRFSRMRSSRLWNLAVCTLLSARCTLR